MISFRIGLRTLWREWIKPFGLFFLIVAPLKSAVVDWNWVPTGSMKPTIVEGDLVFINKLAYSFRIPFSTTHVSRWSTPERGDIAVFLSPEDGTRLVKRVIGLPGDLIEMRDEVIYLNGTPLRYLPLDATPWLHEIHESQKVVASQELLLGRPHPIAVYADRLALRTFPPTRIPAGHYFMMGDARDNSRDSRFFGPVPLSQFTGRASTVLVSFDLNRFLLPRIERIGHALNPSSAP